MATGTRNLLFGKYDVMGKIGEGSFGKIHKGVNVENKEPIAVKIETQKGGSQKQLQWEYKIYKKLEGTVLPRGNPWPQVYNFGKTRGGAHIMVMDRLGPSLDNIRRPVHPVSLAYIAQSIIGSLELFHKKGFVHRDIKPQNILLSSADKAFPDTVLIDYGLSTLVKDAGNYAIGRGLKGTVKYSSINTHLGVEQNIRDDLQSVGYVLLYLAGVEFPWKAVSKSSDKKRAYQKILSYKLSSTAVELSAGLDESIRNVVAEYLYYTGSLAFHAQPSYKYMKRLFSSLASEFDGRIQI